MTGITVAMLLALIQPPNDAVRGLGSKIYAIRERASLSLKMRGCAAIPVVLPLFRHPDLEVRWRARRIFDAVALIRLPAYEEMPTLGEIGRPATLLGLRDTLATPLAVHIHKRAYAAFCADPEPDSRIFVVVLLDRLVRWGVPTRFAQWWFDAMRG
jgi:hypothetical protein